MKSKTDKIQRVDPVIGIEKFVQIYNQSPVAIEIYNSDGILLNANKACLDLFGINKIDEVKGFNLFGDPNLPPQVISNIREGKSFKYEFEFNFELVRSNKLYETSRDGSCFLECYVNPMTDENNEVTGYMVHFNEITERKRSEKMLKENQEMLSLFMKHSPIYTFVKDVTPTESSVIIASENYQDMIGIPGSQMAGKTMFELFPSEFAAKITADDWAVVSSGQVLKLNEDLNDRYYNTIKFPIIQGEKKYLAGYTIDITEQKKIEKALIENRESYRNLTELAVDGILIGSEEGIIIDANSCICAMSGKSREELIGLHISNSIFTPESLNLVPFRFDLLRKSEVVISERNILRPDGTEITIEMHTKMMPDKTYQAILRDVTHRKETEILLAKQAKELLDLNVTKDKFLSIIAHDLKNPFGAIIGFSDLMLKKFYQLDDETILKGLTTIESASNHAYKLLENLLIWSQNQTGTRQFSPENLNLKAQITESLNMVESIAITKGIPVTVSVNKGLQIFADKNMIDSILRNLISNAIKFSNKGGKIKISAIESDHELHISVADHGVGILPGKLSAIFEIDKRTNTAGTENEMGTGLGLILCKDFVSRHQGKIWVKSTPGKGSTFTFSLPITKP